MKKAEGSGQKAVRNIFSSTPCHAIRLNRPARPLYCLLPTAFCLLLSAFLPACAVDEQRGVPVEAQATVDRVTDDIAAGRVEQVYSAAADEWRAQVSAEENRKILERAREQLGRVESRAFHSGTEQGSAGSSNGATANHTLQINYQTTFERGTAMERFTLLEREGRWLLAGYSVTSDALKE